MKSIHLLFTHGTAFWTEIEYNEMRRPTGREIIAQKKRRNIIVMDWRQKNKKDRTWRLKTNIDQR